MTIERHTDKLNKQVWIFTYLDGHLILDAYEVLQKETSRHKFKSLKRYDRLRQSRLERYMSEDAVPFPDDVKKEALDMFMSKIKVIKWSER